MSSGHPREGLRLACVNLLFSYLSYGACWPRWKSLKAVNKSMKIDRNLLPVIDNLLHLNSLWEFPVGLTILFLNFLNL